MGDGGRVTLLAFFGCPRNHEEKGRPVLTFRAAAIQIVHLTLETVRGALAWMQRTG
jgi:hypothetical protein